jgi:hypothetical protein
MEAFLCSKESSARSVLVFTIRSWTAHLKGKFPRVGGGEGANKIDSMHSAVRPTFHDRFE